MPPIHSNVVSADHKAPTMCFRDEGRGGVEVKHARLWEHSNISLSLLCDKTFKGESVRAHEKSQCQRHRHRQIKQMSFKIHKLFTFAMFILYSRICLQSETILQKISSHLSVGHLQWVEARCRVSSISLRPRQYTTLVGLYPCAGSISLWPRQYTTRQHSATQIRSSEFLSPAKSLLSPARVQHMIVSTQIGACANIVCTPLRILSRLV